MSQIYRCRNGGTIVCHGNISRERLIGGVIAAIKKQGRAQHERENKKATAGQGNVA